MPFSALMRSVWPALLPFALLLAGCGRSEPMTTAEAIQTVKALDSDLTRLADAASNDPALNALSFLFNTLTSPLNLREGLPAAILHRQPSDVGTWGGAYRWNADSSFFTKEKGKPGMIIMLGDKIQPCESTTIFFPDWACDSGPSTSCFPSDFKGSIRCDDEVILDFVSALSFEGDWPDTLTIFLEGADYSFSFEMDHSKNDVFGSALCKVSGKAKGFTFLSGTLRIETGYSGSQVFLRGIIADLDLFDVSLTGKFDYSKVDPTAKDYVASFNRHCRIQMSDKSTGKVAGVFGLGKDPTGELMEWVLYSPQGDMISLNDHLLLLKKIMDYKLPAQDKD